MKRVVLLIAVAAVLLSTAAMASDNVTYFTTGAFSTGGGNVLNVGGKTLTYNAEPSWTLDLSTGFSVAPLGSFTENGTLAVPSGETFTLTIWQTAPGAGSATDLGSISGKFTVNPDGTTKSTVFLDFTSATFAFMGTTYSTPAGSPIAGINWGVVSVNPLSTNTTTSLNGIAYTTPEPSSLLLLGAGVSGLLGLVRRKRA
jgi:PEP-CTERM motif